MIILMANNEKEMKEMKEMEKEMKRLKNITDRLWSEGKATKWENMPHTNVGAENYDNKQKQKTIKNFMTKLITTPTTRKSKIQPKSIPFFQVSNNNHKNQYKEFILPRKKVSYAGLFQLV